VLVQPAPGLPDGLVDAAEGGTAVAGDEAGRVETALLVTLVLQHRQAHERLDAGHVGPGRIQGILVVEGNLRKSA